MLVFCAQKHDINRLEVIFFLKQFISPLQTSIKVRASSLNACSVIIEYSKSLSVYRLLCSSPAFSLTEDQSWGSFATLNAVLPISKADTKLQVVWT